MKFKRILIAVAATLALGAAQAQVAKFGFGASDDNSQGLGAKRVAELAKAKTAGRVNISTYGSGKLGTDPQMQSALQGGVQELMVGPTSNLVGLIKEYAMLDLPFLVSNFKEADGLLDGPVGQALAQKLEAHGLVGLAYELYGALETRSVDAQENGLGLIESGKFYEVQKFLSLTGHSYTPYIVLASKKWFDKLSEADRAAVRQAAVEAGAYQRKINREQSAMLVGEMKKHGLQVTEVAPAEIARMREKVKPVHDKFTPQIGSALMAQAKAEIAKAGGGN